MRRAGRSPRQSIPPGGASSPIRSLRSSKCAWRRTISTFAKPQRAMQESRAEREMAASAFYPSSDVNASYANERASPNGVLNLLGTTATNTPATIANGSPGFGPAGITSADTGNASSPAFNLWQYGIDASWEVDIWGRVRRSIEAADAGVELSQDYRRGVLISALAETAGDYVALRGVQAQIAITRENLGVAKHSLALTKLRFANGATTNLDVANATADVAAVGARLPPLQRQESELINALSFMVAAPPRALASSLRPARPLPPIPRKVPVGLPSELAEKRPDIRAAAAQLHAATADIGVAIGDFYPRITLEGSLDIQSLEFSHLGSGILGNTAWVPSSACRFSKAAADRQSRTEGSPAETGGARLSAHRAEGLA